MIETARLLLRQPAVDDIPDLLEVHANPDVERWMGPWGEAEAADWFERAQRSWAERGAGRLVIIDRTTGELVGRTGLQWMDDADEVELGWTLRREAWGRGYATEAARGAAEWAFNALGLEQVTSRIESGNERSQSVARRLGMTVIRTMTWIGRPFDVHGVTRERYFS